MPKTAPTGLIDSLLKDALAAGPKTARQLVEELGFSITAVLEHLRSGPFERADHHYRGSKWQLAVKTRSPRRDARSGP